LWFFYFQFMLPLSTRLPFFCLLAICIGCSSCFSTKQSKVKTSILTANELQPFGRTWMHPQQGLELISSAAHFGFSFEGTECSLTVAVPTGMDHNYIQYELDGKYTKRIRISGKSNEPVIIKATGKGPHRVWIYKATEAHTGAVFIQQITGSNLGVLSQPNAPLIEFIGNSITCGAAADPSEVPCGTGQYHDQHNAYYAYGPRVARALNAGFILSSVSGIGMYRNWNSDGPAMPQVYEEAAFNNNAARPWNFEKYRPKIVSIALGTNDFSNGDGKKARLPFDSALFVSNYVQFVQLVKTKYPAAQIALLSSPMVKGQAR
jgi:lysophospholipase L1-like esterase